MRVVNLDLILFVVMLIPVLLQGVSWKFGTHIGGILLVVLVTAEACRLSHLDHFSRYVDRDFLFIGLFLLLNVVA